MSKIKEALRRAQGDVDQLQAKVAHWQSVVDAKRAELAALEAGLGERVFDDETGGALREYAAAKNDLAAAIEGAQAAALVAEGKLHAARWALADAQAAELREKAAAVRAEAVRRQARVDELKAALEEYEGGSWRPWQPDSQDVIQAGAGGIKLVPLKTPPMFAEADRLDREAELVEERTAAERRQAGVVVPHARIVWPGQHDHGHWVNLAVEAGVNDGVGSVAFEVVKDGEVVESFTLPDGNRQGVRRLIDGYLDELVEVRASGEVLATLRPDIPVGTRPGEVNDGRGRPHIVGAAL